MKALPFLHKFRHPIPVTVAAVAASVSILFLGAACQSNKGAKAPEPVGKDVQMTQLRQVIQTKVADPNRSTQLLGIVGHAEKELGAINKSYLDNSKEFGKMSADHGKSANDLQVFLRNWASQENTRRVRLTDTLLAMKNYATAEEWPAISNAFVNGVMQQSDRYASLRSAIPAS